MITRRRMYGAAAALAAALVVLCVSCGSVPYTRAQSWDTSGKPNQRERQTISLLQVTVDRPGGWDSVEKEVAGLAPFYFWEQGCRMAGDSEPAAYAADIRLREREFISQWRTVRSLALEVRIWKQADNSSAALAVFEHTPVIPTVLPLAAGRIVAVGDRSFASSETISRMLSLAVKKAAGRLHRVTRRDAAKRSG